MKTKKILLVLLMIIPCISQGFAQNKSQAQKEFEENLKNSLIQDAINVVTGNEPTSNYEDVRSFLPGGGISGFIFLSDGSAKDFIGVKYIGMNDDDHSPYINEKPVVWFVDQYSWRSVDLKDVASINYNNIEYVTAGYYKLSVSVSLKDGNSYNYILNPARNFVTLLIEAGNDAKELQIQVFNPSQLFVKSIIFY